MYSEHFELILEIDSIRDSGFGFAKFSGRSSRNTEFSISKSSKLESEVKNSIVLFLYTDNFGFIFDIS